MRSRAYLLVLAAGWLGASGCASLAGLAERATRSATVVLPLDRSLFARDPNGQLTEESLQKILDAPIEIALPMRVGVLGIVTATDWHGPGPSQGPLGAGPGRIARALGGAEHFTMTTEMLTIPSGALGMEALRELAARYRLRYLLLYREELTQLTRANGWAAGYVTGLGALFLPGQQLGVYGFVEASLFDVKTGTLLFTCRRAGARQRRSTVWHQDDKLAALEADLAAALAPELVDDVRRNVARYREAAAREAEHRLAAAPAAASAPISTIR